MAVTVDADYPGGNVIVQRIDGDRLVVRPDLRDTTEWWFWWNFRVRSAAGRTLRVDFDDEKGPVGPNGPAMSVDGGPWRWAGGEFDKSHFVSRAPKGAREVRFAFSFPYQLADLDRFVAARRDHADFHAGTLTATRGGRAAPLLAIGDPRRAQRNVLLCCRHHACESVASYVLEGVIDHVLSPEADALRRTTAFSVVPMVDLDGVEAGDQGKARAPHDHNRDYGDGSIYPTVRAVRQLAGELAQRNLVLYVDLHCPWIRSEGNESVFLVEPPEPWAGRLHRLAAILRETPTGPVPYTGRFDVPFGTSWNTGQFGSVSSGAYMRKVGGEGLLTAFTIECAYSTTEGPAVTPESARAFGRGFGLAIQRFLAS